MADVDGFLEDAAWRALDRYGETDAKQRNLELLLAMKIKVNQLWTESCLAQHVAREAAE